jgi:methionyl-tRNA formyltransferase
MKIIFMGTPDFAVASLDILVRHGYDIAAVVTAPDKPAGRGQKLSESAVKKYAIEKGLRILQPEKLKSPEFIQTLRDLKADLQIVVAFRMLPEVVWNMPPKGTFNLHASLLPQYRGAAPINWAVMNGEKESGVTTFFLQHEIDTGNILFREKVSIGENETAGELHDKLMETGRSLVLKTVQAIEKNSYKEVPQDELLPGEILKHAPKIFKEDCRIDWSKSLDEVHNHIRGLSPYPAAFTEFRGLGMKIFKASRLYGAHKEAAGTFLSDGKNYLHVAMPQGYLQLEEIQLEGKKRMNAAEFLRGFRW